LHRLADILGLERTTLTRNLSALEREGLIQITSVDGRTRNVRLSSTGEARLKQALLLWDQAQENLRRKLGEKEWAILQDGLAQLAAVA
jgi:DNA-binding MarR family transcriptional regulator